MSQQSAKRWNDCWYDEKRKLYVTYNKYFKEIRDIYQSEHQQKYEQETSDDGVALKEVRVKFFFGYPACKVTYKDETSVWFLLPTITDKMLTKEIVKARLMPKSSEQAIMYQTESKPWIEIGDGQLILTEQEYELGKDLGRYTYAPMDAVKALFNKK